jgi:hypothetical protein
MEMALSRHPAVVTVGYRDFIAAVRIRWSIHGSAMQDLIVIRQTLLLFLLRLASAPAMLPGRHAQQTRRPPYKLRFKAVNELSSSALDLAQLGSY